MFVYVRYGVYSKKNLNVRTEHVSVKGFVRMYKNCEGFLSMSKCSSMFDTLRYYSLTFVSVRLMLVGIIEFVFVPKIFEPNIGVKAFP